jgi:hypothetical protein
VVCPAALPPPQDPARFQAGVSGGLKQQHWNVETLKRLDQTFLQDEIVSPTQCGRRNADRGLVPDVFLGVEQRLDAAIGAAGHPNAIRVDHRQLLRISQARELIIELLGL